MKVYVNKLLLVFTFYNFFNTCFAQEGIYFSKNLPYKQTRVLNNIRKIEHFIKDSRGYVWFAAQGGLYRYDGYQTKWYATDEARPNTQSSNPVNAITEDKYGNIWVAIEGIGLKKLDLKTGIFNRVPLVIANEPVHLIEELKKEELELQDILSVGDNLWLQGKFSDFRYSISKNTFYRTEKLVKYVDMNQEIWGLLGGMDKDVFKLYKYDVQRDSFLLKTSYKTPSISNYRFLLATKEYLFITFLKKLMVYEIATNNYFFPKNFENTYIYSMKWGLDSTILLHQDTTIYAFDPKTFTAKPLFSNRFLSQYDMYPLSKNQILLSGDVNTRLLNIAPPVIESFNFTDKFEPFDFSYAHIYPHDAHQLNINNAYIVDFNKTKLFKYESLNPSLKPVSTESLMLLRYVKQYTQPNGTQWFAYFTEENYTYKVHFYSYSPSDKVLKKIGSIQDGIFYDYPAVGFVKWSEKLYVGNYSGLFSFDLKTKAWEYAIEYNPQDSLPDNITRLYVDNDDDFWVSTQNKGVILKKKNQTEFKYFSVNTNGGKDWAANWVSDIVQDKTGTVWIATSKGLFTFDKKTEKLKQQNNLLLLDNFIQNILIDDAQTLWMSHDKGITHYDPYKNTLRHYNDSDGILEELIEEGVKLPDGSLVFNATGRFYRIHPKNVAVDSTPIPIYLTDIQLFNKPIEINGADSLLKQHISYTKAITFKHNQNIISLHYTAIDFVDAENRQYAYLLDNFDGDWQYVGQKQEAVYTNLPPGKYTFRVKSANRDGIWIEMATPLSITVLPPWWKTWWAYLFYIGAAIGSIWAFMNYRSRNLRRQNKLLEDCVEERTSTVVAQKEELSKTLNELKATQAQLIQSEKLASLGELTAGIAHEIQNPLNFVNNFSELSVDLADELDDEIKKPELDRDLIIDLTKDIKSNQEKINHHGKRASSIVKGMLEHSRASTGVKEWVDINKLADEYLRLSYHGLRAKDKDFNANYELIIDEGLPKIEVVPQDIGRVLLNLINNAFYAVKPPYPPKGGSYVPTVTVSTLYVSPPLAGAGGACIISVKDNGVGMSEAVKAKVFQPFFTTKPTGQGTGLGLSLAYDIVTKGHGGTLEVESTVENSDNGGKEVGTTFIIKLPNIQH